MVTFRRWLILQSVLLLSVGACGDGLVDSDNPGFLLLYQNAVTDTSTPDSSDYDGNAANTIGVGGPCVHHAECQSGLSCLAGTAGPGMCSKVCDTQARDCPAPAICVADPEAGRPIPICFVPCQSDGDCKSGARIGRCLLGHRNFVDGVCLQGSCQQDADCPSGYRCHLPGSYCEK